MDKATVMKYKCMSTREIGERHGFHFERLGDKWRGLCLFHNDQGTPNMFVYPDDSFFCFACVDGSTKVVDQARGLIPIATLQVGDRVLGKDGEFVAVTRIQSKVATEELEITLHKNRIPLLVTPDHGMMAADITYRKKRRVDYARTAFSLREISADKVTANMMMGTPKLRRERIAAWYVGGYFDKHGGINSKGPVSKAIPGQVVLTDDLMWTIGMYVAEGSVSGNRVMSFALHSKEVDYAKRMLQAIENSFGIKGNIHYKKKGKSLSVYFCNTYLVDVFSKACGKGAANKHLPRELLASDNDNLLLGVMQGDGHLWVQDHQAHSRLIVISEELAHQVYMLAVAKGERPSLSTRAACVYAGCNHRRSYTVVWSSGISNFSISMPGAYFTKVDKVISRKRTRRVYDITVDGGVFVANGTLIHNCKAGGPKSMFVARVLRVSKKLIDKIWTDSDPIEEVMALQLSGKQVNFKPHLQLFLAKFSRAMLERSKTFDWTELKKYDDFMHGTKAITSEQYAGVVEELTTKYGGIINGKLDDAGTVQRKPTGA